jgi:4-amino-4-deoxy-L-arabinose transferase-like glycosyltransferase
LSWDSLSYAAPWSARLSRRRARGRLDRVFARPELLGLLGLAGILNLWGLSINGWANQYYSAAVRSMSTSWHDFLFASLDRSGLMTVDKPPLSLWIQALSARVFGFHPLSLLVPQALMGVVAVGLLYDLVRRRFGRVAGFVAGFALATTPVIVAVSRHNNPDELLVLCSVAALWFALRALETGRTRWLVLSGIAVGLGFETKMGVALMVVPGIAAAWMWVAPSARGRWVAFRQLLAGGAAMAVVGLAWPVLVWLTPAADRPWISGTSDNSIWSLIFGYNGLGRVAGQNGGPGGPAGGGGALFGGPTGVFRLVGSALGDQAGWLIGFAVVAAVALVVISRLRRSDPRTGWVIVVGGAFLTTAVVFSFASGIFHPYYVSLLAPFTAALIGAGVGEMVPGDSRRRSARIVGPLAVGAGLVTELVVLGEIGGQLAWAIPLAIAVAGLCAVLLATAVAPKVRLVLIGVALAALLAAPTTWAAETLGHATSGTFPMGGPASVVTMGGGGFSPGSGAGAGSRGRAGGPGGLAAQGSAPGSGSGAGVGGPPPGAGFPGAGGASGGSGSAVPGGFGGAGGGFGGARGGFAGGGAAFGGDTATLQAAVQYAKAHGGGTIGVASQSSAATVILSSDANVAGLGGFSGRESSVTAAWLAAEVADGHLRWVIVDQSQGAGLPGDTRTGSQAAMDVVSTVCRAVTFTTSSGTRATMYDCSGRADAILAASKIEAK